MSVKNEKSKASVKSTMEKIKDSFVRFLKPAASANRRLCAVVCNTDGAATAMDIALDLVIGVVLGVLVLAALKNLFNVDILPQVTDNITNMFS